MSDGENWLEGAVSEGMDAVREFTTFLGIERERYVCPDCGVACEESTTYDPQRVAFDGGKSPSWYCESCGSHYVREIEDASHGLDLYGRDPPQ